MPDHKQFFGQAATNTTRGIDLSLTGNNLEQVFLPQTLIYMDNPSTVYCKPIGEGELPFRAYFDTLFSLFLFIPSSI